MPTRLFHLLFSCAFLLTLLPGFRLQAQSPVTLRVMSANLTSGNSQKYETAGLDILKGLQPDIVAIQEFNFSNNAPADFRLMLDTTFGTNYSYFREAGYALPNGIISRYPILDSGSWQDAVVSNRGFAWARIDLPGTNNLYVVSVHLYSSGTAADRNTEALELRDMVQTNFPANAWVIVAGDFNTSSRSEAAITTFSSFLSDTPIPTDAETGGDPDTNEGRTSPYDYLLPSFSLTNLLTPLVLPSHTFTAGLVFDSRVYSPLTDVPPVLPTDSATNGMQHMGVVKAFSWILNTATNVAPSISGQPQNQNVAAGGSATFAVTASGSAPLKYQWRQNGASITGASSSSYTRTNAQSGDAGSYTVVVTNNFGSVTSSVATLTVNSGPVITAQPQNQTVTVGSDATFSVTASSGTTLSYQWRFNSVNIGGATNSTYTVTNAQISQAGNFSVVVTNVSAVVTSSVAVLTVLTSGGAVLAQWNFNSLTPDANTATGTITVSAGAGAASLVGGTTATFATGSTGDPAPSDNSGWNLSSFPAQATANKTAGALFKVSTAGKQNIIVRWDQKPSSTGTKYARLQYTTNGTTFTDYPAASIATNSTLYESRTNGLAGFAGVNDNTNFAFRIVAEFESTAIANANANYVGASGTYGTGGTFRLDMVTVTGDPISSGNSAAPALLGGIAATGIQQFQFTVSGSAGSNYAVLVASNLVNATWVAVITNASPFIFIETNRASYNQRFYRAVWVP